MDAVSAETRPGERAAPRRSPIVCNRSRPHRSSARPDRMFVQPDFIVNRAQKGVPPMKNVICFVACLGILAMSSAALAEE